jgi:hypothetical protein
MKDEFSPLHDPLAVYRTTLSGQLSLSMLAEQLVDNIDIQMIQINTDGLTFRIRKVDKDKMFKICKDWEKQTNLILEYVKYKKMIVRDVNNYIAQDDKDYIKYKGCFEIDKKIGNEHAVHKNNSQRIVPIALKNYFIDNIPLKETIINHKEIYDFCIGRKKGKNQQYVLVKKDENIELNDKIIRYFISNTNNKLYKIYKDKEDSKPEKINKGFNVSLFMNHYNSNDYNIDYNFYINECNKIINSVNEKKDDSNQLKLWQ